jgi:hypothetical protein
VLKYFDAADGVADGISLQFSPGVIEFDQIVIPKSANFLVEVRISRIDPALSATASATRVRESRFVTLMARIIVVQNR